MSCRVLACIVLLGLVPSCGARSDSDRWQPLSKAVQAFADKHGGQVLDRGGTAPKPPCHKHWLIVLPVEDVSVQILQARTNDLAEALGAADPRLAGASSGTLDPSIVESEEGKFTMSSGPALMEERRSEGRDGMLFVTAKAAVRDSGPGYYPVMGRSATPKGKKALLFDVFAMRWR